MNDSKNKWLHPDSILLPRVVHKSGMSVEEVLRKRRSVRSFSKKSISLDELASLLWSAQGITSETGRRTAPSAYARNPLVLLVIAERVEGLARGMYRYISDNASGEHHLEPAGGVTLDGISNDAIGLEEIHNPAALILFAYDPSRTFREDGTSTAEWAPIDGAMAMENLLLEAVALGLGAVSMADLNAEQVVKETGIGFIPLFAAPVGWPQ